MSSSTPLQLYRGSLNDINSKLTEIEDGRLIFAVDTKQIYLDYDVDNGLYEEPTRIKFGGSTGIWYGKKEDTGEALEVIFSISDLEDTENIKEYPSVKDLILNKDGSFFKVTDLDIDLDQILTRRLTVSGVGGGTGGSGSGAIDYGRIGPKARYFSSNSSSMELTFVGQTTAEYAELFATISLIDVAGNKQLLGTTKTLQPSMDKENPIIIDIKPYLEAYGYSNNESYDIEVLLEDNEGNVAFKPIPYTITIFNIYVDKILDIGATNVDSRFYCRPVFYRGLTNVELHARTIHSDYQNILENISKPLTNASNGEQETIDVSIQSKNYPVGSYKIEVWITAVAEGVEVSSEILTSTFIVTSADASDPQIALTDPTKINYKQYESIDLEYFIAYGDRNSNPTIDVIRDVYFTDPLTGETTKIDTDTRTQNAYVDLVWTYRFMKLGTYRFVIYAGANKLVKAESNKYNITEASGDIPSYAISSLDFNLLANKSNESPDRDTWQSSGSHIVNTTFKNFNWISNGWMTDKDGAVSLYLNNGAKIEIPYYPFVGSSITKTGLTIELDCMISNVRDRSKEIISWASRNSDDILYSGIIVNGDYFTINSNNIQPIKEYNTNKEISLETAGMTSTYVHNKRIRITWVIAPKDSSSKTIAKNMVYTYVNGVMSGFVSYSNDTFGKASNATESSNMLIVDSSFADVNLYGVRVYATSLTDRAILNNYFASFSNFMEASSRWEDNNLLNDNGELDVKKVIAMGNNPTKKNIAIPYILMRGGCGVTDKKGKTFNYEGPGNSLVTRLPIEKEDYRLIDMCFIDPADSSRNIGSLASKDRIEATIYAQGTSSMDYPIKNLRMYFARDNVDYEYQLFEHIPPVNLFCHKADYMESSSSHNTGLGNVLNDLYGDIKPPSRLLNDTYSDANGNVKEYDYVTAIKGRPIVIFFKETLTDPRSLRENEDDYSGYRFIGRYNFNLDKSTHKPFGFYSDEDKHYGVAVKNPPLLNPTITDKYVPGSDINYLNNLKNCEIINGFIATFDKKPDANKTYYHKPIKDDRYKWNDTELANLSHWQKHVAYEEVNVINSIQVWECLNNNLPLTHFQSGWSENEVMDPKTQLWNNPRDKNNLEWKTAFESRYPKYEFQEKADKRELTRLVNWLHETDCCYHTDRIGNPIIDEETGEQKVDENGDPMFEILRDYYSYPPHPSDEEIERIISGEITTVLKPLVPDENGNPKLVSIEAGKKVYEKVYGYIYDSKEYRLTKFANEFDKYFESDLTLVYYLLTEFLLMIDSRAKNMMLCTFTANCVDNDGNSKTTWFPIFYDMDTGLGVNNMGQLKFSYKDEDWFGDIFNAEASYYDENNNLNTSYSTLFTNIRETMQDRLRTVYAKLRNGTFNYQTMLDAYNTKQADRWNETYINQDAYLKYVEPKINDSKWKVMVEAAQGTRSLNREQFLRRRFLYMDSKYAYVTSNTGFSYRLYSRLINPANIYQFSVTTKDAMYWLSAINKENIKRGQRIEEGSTNVYITPHPFNNNTGEQEFYIYIPENIISLGDLSTLGIQDWDMYGKSTVEENTLAMTTLNLSTNQPGWEYGLKLLGRMTNLDIIENFPMLETLNVGYWNGLKSLNLSNNKNLKILNAYGTVLNSCIFPEGGILETLELPSTLTDINLTGHYNLTNIGYRYYESGWDEKGTHNAGTDSSFNQEYFDQHVVIKDDAWEHLLKLSVVECPKLDTKNIFKLNWQTGKTSLQIYLPDLNWTMTEEDFNLDGDMISNFPILDALVRRDGYGDEEYAFNDDDTLKLNRSYVGGTIKIMNGNYGINEEQIYNQYTKYYPYLKFEYENWNNKCIRAYSLNTYDPNMKLLVTDCFKFTSENVNTKFSFDNLFKNKDSETYIAPIDKSSSNEYFYKFVGWNTEGVLAFHERDYVKKTNPTDQDYEKALQQAYEDAQAKLIIAYDGTSYSIANNFDFTSVFNETKQELNIYPTFVANIRNYTASFYDGIGTDGKGTLVNEYKVRYGDYATPPDIKPVNIVLNPIQKSVTTIYPFLQYGNAGEDYHIVRDMTYIAQYDTKAQDIHSAIASDEYFSINSSGELKLLNSYPYKAICIPKVCQNINVKTFSLNTNTNVKRIYFEPDNEINKIPSYFCQNDEEFEYIEFHTLTKLIEIGQQAFDSCINMECSALPDSIELISYQAFNNCTSLMIPSLPFSLREMGVGSFMNCTSLQEVSFNSPELIAIGQQCFKNCTNLQITEQTLPDKVVTVGLGAFYGCENLIMNFATGAAAVTSFSTDAFYGTSNLTLSGSLPDNLITIGARALRDDASQVSNLNLLTFPNNLKTIGARAFYNRKFIDTDGNSPVVLDLSNCTELTNWSDTDSTGIHAQAFMNTQNSISTIKVARSSKLNYADNNAWGSSAQVVEV